MIVHSDMHVLPVDGMDGLPDLPEEALPGNGGGSSLSGAFKKDPTEDAETLGVGHGGMNGVNNTLGSPGAAANGTIPTNGTTPGAAGEPTMIKANKGMILRKVRFLFSSSFSALIRSIFSLPCVCALVCRVHPILAADRACAGRTRS